MFGRRFVNPLRRNEQRPIIRDPQREENEGCEINVKRDDHGKISKIVTKGKCSKEDRMIFAKENGINLEED